MAKALFVHLRKLIRAPANVFEKTRLGYTQIRVKSYDARVS